MVRVISMHHFASQNVQTVEQPTACTVAPPDRLLLALTNNCIEVRNLQNDSEVQFFFPTVDEAVQIVHCLNGDYVASLETKYNRQNRDTNFVRVYINWDSVAAMQQSKMTSGNVSLGASECGMVQPMRARIAGRVTPTTNQSELGSLEMIEVPVRRNPNCIACCQVSGNLAILSSRLVNIYKFQVRTHDISKLKFIDFDEMPIMMELSFAPFEIQMCENYVAAIGSDTMHLFRVLSSDKTIEGAASVGMKRGNTEQDFSFLYSHENPIDFAQLKKDEKQKRQKVTVNLPSIAKENSLIHKHSPFTFTDKDLRAAIKPINSLEDKTQCYQLQDLIQLKLLPILIENNQRQISEEFKSMILKPLYIDQQFNRTSEDHSELRSHYSDCLNSVACMVVTQQEGYLHFFADKDVSLDEDNCIAVYPFTAPVFKVIMEDYFLHALTETGLETYTLRIGHQLCRNINHMDSMLVAIPSIEDSICLVGLGPFLGVERMLLADNYLLLLANSESSPARSVSSSGSSTATFLTLYALELPTPKAVFNDISIVANVHRFSSAQTYCHLVSEAHMILRMGLMLKKWAVVDEAHVKGIFEHRAANDDLVDIYLLSCALLGDHYMMCPNEASYRLVIPYYRMALISPMEALKRVKKLQDQSNSQVSKGLMNYLKHTLLEIKTSYEADRYFGNGSKNSFSEAMLDLLERQGFSDLPNLILKSRILREYSTDKLINILVERCSDATNLSEKNLALSILYLQKGNAAKAEDYLQNITKDNAVDLLQENWELLFETTFVSQGLQQRPQKGTMSFSDLSVALISICPEILADIFVTLILDMKAIGLARMIKVFLEYLPSSIGKDSTCASTVLQKTLEAFFTRYFSKPENVDVAKVIYEKGATDAMKLLVRSYLSQLQMLQLKADAEDTKEDSNGCADVDDSQPSSLDEIEKDKDQEKLQYNRIYKTYFNENMKKRKASYLFSQVRHEYLDKMPPFQIDITAKVYEVCVEGYVAKEAPPKNPAADAVLKKLQALLCSKVVPNQVIVEVNGFLAVNDTLRGSDSLKTITMGTNDAVLLLIDVCPQCLLQFAKDRFAKAEEWKFLVATIQRRILRLSQQENLKRVCFFHKKILRDVLTFAASSYTVDQLQLIFPQRFSQSKSGEFGLNGDKPCRLDAIFLPEDPANEDADILSEIQDYEPYIAMCKGNQRANDINKMLTNKAYQLLNTLNL
uniref:CNH domain-containing protein n=1 Tax=Dendroctonus ponderosae TaxID=77166 RepID=A0AAR5Q491_DENPD